MEMKVLRAVVICMNRPYPINNGTRLRSWSVIASLKALGYEVTVVYPVRRRINPNLAKQLGVAGDIAVIPTFIQRMWHGFQERVFKNSKVRYHSYKRISISRSSKLELKKLPEFDIAITEYARTTSVSRHIRAKHHILDTCDILSFYNIKANKLLKAMNQQRADGKGTFSQLETLDKLKPADIRSKELSDFRKYGSIIAIAEKEFAIFQEIRLPNVRLIPPCVGMPAEAPQNYSGLPIFPFSKNIFNLQGLYHFKEHILPHIIREEPDFRMVITGKPPVEILNVPHFICPGHVEDLGRIYREAGFAIVPVFNGTGQQLKIPELMSYGIPVVTYRMRVDESIMSHGQGGLLASNESEFVKHVLELWRDRKLAAEMGKLARQTASSRLSQSHFNSEMADLIRSLKGGDE